MWGAWAEERAGECSGRRRAMAGKADPSYGGTAKPSRGVAGRPLSGLRKGPMRVGALRG